MTRILDSDWLIPVDGDVEDLGVRVELLLGPVTMMNVLRDNHLYLYNKLIVIPSLG